MNEKPAVIPEHLGGAFDLACFRRRPVFVFGPVRVTGRDVRRWLLHVAGFADPDSMRAQSYRRLWNVEFKIRRAFVQAALQGLPKGSVFRRWDGASW